MKPGDLVWQERKPGGWCTILEVYEGPYCDNAEKGWLDKDYPILRIAHPVEGVIDDPSYYYLRVDDYRYLKRMQAQALEEEKDESR